jgi:hypothetical protein
VYRRLLPLPLVACSVAACMLVTSGCSSSGARNAASNSSSPTSVQTTSATPADTAAAAIPASAAGAESDPDTDLDGNGKVDLAKFLTPSSTHGPKDAACVALFGSGAALERATSFAAQAMGVQYTLESYDELPAGTTFTPLTSNGPGQCVYGLVQSGGGPEGELFIGITRAGSHVPAVKNESVVPLFTATSVVRGGLRVLVQTTASAQTDFIHVGQYYPASASSLQRLTDYVVGAALAHVS